MSRVLVYRGRSAARQPGSEGPASSAPVGQEQHRQLRRMSRENHDLRRRRGWSQRALPHALHAAQEWYVQLQRLRLYAFFI